MESTGSGLKPYGLERVEIAGDKIIGWGAPISPAQFFASEDGGLSFQGLHSLQAQFGTYIVRLDNDNGTLYAQSSDQRLFRSSDGGDQWTAVGAVIPIEQLGNPFWLMGGLLFVRGQSVFIFNKDFDSSYDTKVLFSNDLGQTWQLFDQLATGFPWGGGIFQDLVQSGGYLIAATAQGVFYSADSGTSWTAWNEGLQNRDADRLCLHSGYLWSSIHSDGVWKRPLGDLAPLAAVSPGTVLPLTVVPNPTSDHFRVETAGENGWLTARDMLGRTVFAGKISSRSREISCQEWPAGVYHLVLSGEGERRVARLVIQK